LADNAPLPVADRIALVRSTLTSFPEPATGAHRDAFARLVDAHGIDRLHDYLRERKIVNAAIAAHSWHPQVADEAGPLATLRRAGPAIQQLHAAELGRLAAAFAGQGVDLAAYKGVALDLLLGNRDAPSLSADIDVLLRSADFPRARTILEGLGYEADLHIARGRVQRMPAPITRMTEGAIYSFGQSQPYCRLVPAPALEPIAGQMEAAFPRLFCVIDGVLHFKLAVDPHYTLNLLSDDIGTRTKPVESVWWQDTQEVAVGDGTFTTLSDRVLSWALLHRQYVDSMVLQETTIKPLAHVKLLRHHNRFDVDHIRDVARRYPYLSPSLHYALRAADQLCGLGVEGLVEPEALRTQVAPTMNVGDCLPVLLDVGVAFDLNAGGLSARYF
jgi:hypothetical protein